jgi:hypothetical protein
MPDVYSQCCGAPPDEYFGTCSRCHDHAGFETLCAQCEDPCLVDGQPILNPTTGDHEVVAYAMVGGEEHAYHNRCLVSAVETRTPLL